MNDRMSVCLKFYEIYRTNRHQYQAQRLQIVAFVLTVTGISVALFYNTTAGFPEHYKQFIPLFIFVFNLYGLLVSHKMYARSRRYSMRSKYYLREVAKLVEGLAHDIEAVGRFRSKADYLIPLRLHVIITGVFYILMGVSILMAVL